MELYGAVGPLAGAYTVDLDNRGIGSYSALKDQFSPRTLLYQESGLAPGKHTVTITNTGSGQTLNIDYAVFWGQS